MNLARASVWLVGAALFGLVGCRSKLPGPLQCEKMAVQGLGGSLDRIEGSKRAQALLAMLTNACLTTPFDKDAVQCIEAGRGLRRCADELALRHPERLPALRSLVEELEKEAARARRRH